MYRPTESVLCHAGTKNRDQFTGDADFNQRTQIYLYLLYSIHVYCSESISAVMQCKKGKEKNKNFLE